MKNSIIVFQNSLIPSSKPKITFSPISAKTVLGEWIPKSSQTASTISLKILTIGASKSPKAAEIPLKNPSAIFLPISSPLNAFLKFSRHFSNSSCTQLMSKMDSIALLPTSSGSLSSSMIPSASNPSAFPIPRSKSPITLSHENGSRNVPAILSSSLKNNSACIAGFML